MPGRAPGTRNDSSLGSFQADGSYSLLDKATLPIGLKITSALYKAQNARRASLQKHVAMLRAKTQDDSFGNCGQDACPTNYYAVTP